jgi:hypothetical protein
LEEGADLRVLVARGVGGGVGGEEKVGVPLLLLHPFHHFQEYIITIRAFKPSLFIEG